MVYVYDNTETLRKWVAQTVNTSEYGSDDREKLSRIGYREIEKGGLRGNISEKWRAAGFDPVKIPDFYP